MGADETGDDAAAVDVADEHDRHVGRLGEAHVGDVAGAEIDFGRAAGALDQHDVHAFADDGEAFQHLRGSSSPFRRPYSAARIVPARLPCTMTCAPVSVSGLSRTGFMWTDGASRAARACSAWARPISPPPSATAALFDMFCGLNGATFSPRRTSARQSPATSTDLPTWLPVPWIISAGGWRVTDRGRARSAGPRIPPWRGRRRSPTSR